ALIVKDGGVFRVAATGSNQGESMKTKIKSWSLMACAAAVLASGVIGCTGDRYHRSTGAYLDDKAVSTKVKTALLTDPAVKGTQVRVRTYQGKVQLSGFVDNQAER